MSVVQSYFASNPLPSLLVVGLITFAGVFLGKSMKYLRLPSILGFMVVGVVVGPGTLGFLTEQVQSALSFVTSIALGFVAVSIGLELSFSGLRRQGGGLVVIIIAESFLAFAVVGAAVYLLTRNLPLALIFGALAPASAPAGTVAVIHEYNARGPLTKALYSVVGFDDGLGIVIFGFAAAIARALLPEVQATGGADLVALLLVPLKEIGLSLAVGLGAAIPYALIARSVRTDRDILPLTFAFVLITSGLTELLHLSLILTNMVFGMFVVNSQPAPVISRIKADLARQMPLLFVLFFVLAGANLHVAALPALGLIGLVYIAGRSAGLLAGAFLGAVTTRAPSVIRKYLGMGILSQAGVAIGLALVVSQEFTPIGPSGAYIGRTVLTTVTATSIFFELIGPVLTKTGLQRAGEIGTAVNAPRSGRSH
jgi:Kef-type K+ transport system membrane component KefB